MFKYETLLRLFTVLGAFSIGGLTESWAQATDVDCTSCVDAVDIAGGAVTSGKIADGEVKTPDLADGAVTGAKVKDGSIDLNDLSPAVQQVIADLQAQVAALRGQAAAAESDIAALEGDPIFAQSGFIADLASSSTRSRPT